MHRGRSRAEGLESGDVVDCWRVEHVEPYSTIRLGSEMLLPGRIWLQFEFSEATEGSVISQTVLFEPHGNLGLFCWYMLFVPHWVIFGGLLSALGRRAEHQSCGHLAEVSTASCEPGFDR